MTYQLYEGCLLAKLQIEQTHCTLQTQNWRHNCTSFMVIPYKPSENSRSKMTWIHRGGDLSENENSRGRSHSWTDPQVFVSFTERFKCMIDMNFGLNLYLINLYNSPSLQTESCALEKSTKQA